MITTGLQLAILGGVLAGAGLAGLVWRLAPVHAHPGDVLARLSPDADAALARANAEADPADGATLADRLGRWGIRLLPRSVWGTPPRQELALMRIPLHRFYGDKLLYALVGLLIPAVLTSLFAVLGWRMPIVLPVGAALAMGVGMFFLPDYNVRDDAKKARIEFDRALGAWTDLVALERNSGSGPRQAMEVASAVGDSWVFRRLREELALSAWTGEPPWDALKRLSTELGLPELGDVADIMRLSGEEGSQVYSQLRARSTSMRTAMLNDELAAANAVGEKMTIPMSLLGVVFLVILIVPALLRMIGAG